MKLVGHLSWIRDGKRPDGTEVKLPRKVRRDILRHFHPKPDGAEFQSQKLEIPCVHLGTQKRVEVCDDCGRKGTPAAVFSCSKHKECTLRKFKKSGVKAVCLTCPDYRAAEQKVMTWAVGITTAPRAKPTLETTLQSVRSAGWMPVVYAEPRSPIPDGAKVVRRSERLGAWRNWLKTAEQLLAADTSHVLILQDDVELCADARRILEETPWPADVGCRSLYTSARYHREGGGLHDIPNANFWGACALAFPAAVLRRLIDSKVMREWRGPVMRRAKDPAEIKNVDTAVGNALEAMGVRIQGWSPSLAQHIGETSTLTSQKAEGNRVAKEVRIVEQPKVSVVITARNYGRFLPEAIESALAQSVPCDVVYSDDFSSDGSVDIARRYEDRGVIVLSAASHRGVAAARNRGAAAATGDYLIHLDGDDMLTPTFAADHLAAMATGVPFAYGPAKAFGEGPRAGNFWQVPPWETADIWSGNSCNTSSMYARWAFDAVVGWRDGIGTMWDWDIALRMMRLGTPRASGAILMYRQHPQSWSHQFREFDDGVRPGHQIEMRSMNATLSIGMVFSGRLSGLFPEWLRRVCEAIRATDLPAKPDLTILDNSNSEDVAAMLRRETDSAGGLFSTVRIVPHTERFAWETELDRRDKVASFMARACNRLRSFMRGDQCWIIEDDVLVPENACRDLRRTIVGTIDGKAYGCPHAATGAYRTRHGSRYYVAGWHRQGKWPHVDTLPKKPIHVDYSGTGCLMFWRDRPAMPKSFRSHYDGAAAHDWAWGLELKANGGTLVFVPSVLCGHAQTESEVLW